MIATRGLRYAYPRGPDLVFADVDLPQGGTLLVRGSSGAGKSTWLALIAGLLSPSAGRATVAGAELGAMPGRLRDAWRGRHLGFLPQKLHLSDALTVTGNLELAFLAAGLPVDRRALADALAALDVAELAARKPSQLSGGQAQRVALARAVLLRPQVLVADEPTASLDDEAAAAAIASLRECAARCGASLVVATHDARVVGALPDATSLQLQRAGVAA